jgi:hypothetical protein
MRSVLLGVLLLSACAADQVRLERAGDVSTQAKTTVDAANAYVAGVQTRRRDAAIALVASDPTCTWGPYLTIDANWDGKRGLCDMGGVPANRRVRINLQPVSQQGLKALTETIAGLAAYQGALTDVLDNKPADARAAVSGAIQTLSTASTDINRIAGADLIDLGPLTDGRATAVAALIGTLVELQQTNLQVGKVRAIVAKTDSATLIGHLKDGASKLNTLQDANSATYRLFALDKAYSRERTGLDFTARLQRVRDLATATDDVTDGGAQRLAVLTAAIDKLGETDAKLRDALAGKFSAAERKTIAQENRKELFSILSQVAAIFPPL